MRRTFVLTTSLALVLAGASFGAARADETGPAPQAPAAEAKAVGVVFEQGKPAFADVLAKAKAAGKPVFVQFSTDWCGWCRKLEKDTFGQASVGELMNGFVNVYIDAEKGEGIELAKKYAASGFPTLVVMDADGGEIDRIVGYMAPAAFTTEIKRIQSGVGTLAALRKAFDASGGTDIDAGIAYGAKLAVANPADAAGVFEKLTDAAKSKDRETQGRLQLECAATLLASGQAPKAVDAAETLVRDFADTASAAKAATRVGRAFVRLEARRALTFFDAVRHIAKDAQDRAAVEQLTIAVHENGITAALKRQGEAAGDDAQALNAVAWTCFERKVNLREATGWARKAVDASGRDPAILDTLANLLWISNAREEALKIEGEAAQKADGPMKKEFEALIAKWTAEQAAMKAAHHVPMTPLEPAPHGDK
ncbi:MAG: thioredoxin fold domain-containing protein [Planctomycetes bacterium]|nr:thioredoxin fold domain-containing protein [Planctomycetota bacterium]